MLLQGSLSPHHWTPGQPTARLSLSEVWLLRVKTKDQSLWLRFHLLISKNGFRKLSEIWAIASSGETRIPVRQTFDLNQFSWITPSHLKIENNELAYSTEKNQEASQGSGMSRGAIRSKANQIEWDLKLSSQNDTGFSPFSDLLHQTRILHASVGTLAQNLRCSGAVTINGNRTEWQDASAVLSHLKGSHLAPQWIWAHAIFSADDKGDTTPLVFEGYGVHPRFARFVRMPGLAAFQFYYRGTQYSFQSLWSHLRARFSFSSSNWEFVTEQGDLSFHGHIHAEMKDLAAYSHEDTAGSLRYGALSQVAQMKLHIYRRGKLETSYTGNASFEWHSDHRNNYIPLVL